MNNEYFLHLAHLPELPGKYLKEAEQAEYQVPLGNSAGIDKPKTTRAQSSFIDTAFCRAMARSVGSLGPVYAEYLRFDPMSIYDWHKDLGRNFAINFLLTPSNSITMFREPQDIPNNYSLVVCDYTLNRPTLFNTQFNHAVVNNCADTRYILSVYVKKPMSYWDARAWLLDYKTDSY